MPCSVSYVEKVDARFHMLKTENRSVCRGAVIACHQRVQLCSHEMVRGQQAFSARYSNSWNMYMFTYNILYSM